MTKHPVQFFLSVFFGFAFAVTFLMVRQLPDAHPVLCWMAAVSAAAFCAVGYDKGICGTGRTRIPEIVLLLLAAAGGAPAVLIAMQVFRHKTAKRSFQAKLLAGMGVQIVLTVIWGSTG